MKGATVQQISQCATLRWAWIKIVSLSILLASAGAAVALAEHTPTESVKSVITEVMRVLDDPALVLPARSAERRRAIEEVVRHHVNYENMARHALGASWMDISALERQQFVSLFVGLLRDMLAGRINHYSSEQVIYLSERREGNIAEVNTSWVGDKVDTSFDVRLVKQGGDWLMYDAVIDGVSIVENYRAQFASIIRDVSYAGLLSRMKQKTVVVKAFEHSAVP
jgi:phospholipid transport system substrate-binding protein